MKLEPPLDPPAHMFDLAAEAFPPVLMETPLAARGRRGWQLARIAAAGDLISREIQERIEAGPLDVDWDWRTQINTALGGQVPSGDTDEENAREEKTRALRVLARSRVSVLVGPAGTGKTSMLKALCMYPKVRNAVVHLLAPTGKAQVQLAERVGLKAETIAGFLWESGRWDRELGYRLRPEARTRPHVGAVVVDEASMLTEEMLAALLEEVPGVRRLVLCIGSCPRSVRDDLLLTSCPTFESSIRSTP
jgi:hypothetical protein